MDDLRMLRDFGRELEHEPPPTLVRQRTRFLRPARPRLWRFGWLMTAVVVLATVTAVALPTLLIGSRQAPGPAAVARPAKLTGALNVLLVGTDGQAGSPRFREDKGERTDTILLLHLPADRKTVTGISIPRDSMVRIPACGSEAARVDMISSAYHRGGMSCAVRTVESLTDVRVDHTVELDFAGFARLTDALGGVEVTLPRAVDDKQAKLKLPAGRSVVTGEQALGYVRLRHYGADGSDVQRIKRQHQLMAAMLSKARKTLTDPAKLQSFLVVASKSVKTDSALDIDTMLEIAITLQRSSLKLLTVPWQPHPDNPNRIAWKQPEARELFAALR